MCVCGERERERARERKERKTERDGQPDRERGGALAGKVSFTYIYIRSLLTPVRLVKEGTAGPPPELSFNQ